jgi:hypothetical protein
MRVTACLSLTAILLVACAKAETPPADTAAMAPAAPAALTEADIAGTWTGTATPEGSDSVMAHWTQVCGGGTCTGTSQESKDTVMSTYTLSADSSIGVSSPYTDPTLKVKVVDHWVARASNGQVTGTGAFHLADKPDSVVMRYRFQGTRQP